MHDKRRHQILLMAPNDFHTPLDCSSLHLLFLYPFFFCLPKWRSGQIIFYPFLFVRSLLYSVTGFHSRMFILSSSEAWWPVFGCSLPMAYVPFGPYLLTLDFTSRAFSSPFVMAACFFVVLNITRTLYYVNLFFKFFLFSFYISHNCLFYYVFFR